jgi:hypothetical protein
LWLLMADLGGAPPPGRARRRGALREARNLPGHISCPQSCNSLYSYEMVAR